jgi:hypothetical protein
MTEKMEQIESKVRGTVEDTTSTLRQTFDLKYQVSERPWAALGLSVLVGYALGSMGENDRSPGYTSHRDLPFYGRTSEYSQPQSSPNGGNGNGATMAAHAYAEPKKPAEPGFIDTISEQFGDELHLLKGAAIASVVGLIRDTLKQSLPGVYQEMERARTTQSQSPSPTYYESLGASEDPNRRTQGPAGTHENFGRSPYASE